MTRLQFRAKVVDGAVRVPQLHTGHLVERDNMLHDRAIAMMQESVKLTPRTYAIDEHPALTNLTPGKFIATIEVNLPTWKQARALQSEYQRAKDGARLAGHGLLESEDIATNHILELHYNNV